MVPVLSSRSVSTSPAASTARPDSARTLRRTRRSMPAMPIAESNAPIVVGIRATSSAIRVVTEISVLANRAKGRSDTITSMKMRVSAASRIPRAISLGVLRRAAPSTSAIIRSRKLFPGSCVISTTIRSDSTRVPPVTALRSPPASRMTGADSPVIADSSTEAIPSITVPSLGITSPASHTTRSPLRNCDEEMRSSLPPGPSRRAIVSVRARRRLAACALPRPSASASAKLANTIVNHSQRVIWPTNSSLTPPRKSPPTKTMVVMTDPTSTTNITGLRSCQRGSSLVKLSIRAGTMMSRSSRLDRRRRRYCSERVFSSISVRQVARRQLEVLQQRSESQGREEGESADNQDHADEQPGKERPVGGQGACAGRNHFLAGQGAGQRQDGDHLEEAPQPHGRAAHGVPVDRVAAQAGEGAAVVADLRGEGIENLAEAVGSGVQRPAAIRRRCRREHGDGGESQDDEHVDQDGQRGQPDFS